MYNHPIWIMSSAFPMMQVEDLVKTATHIGAQGIDLCVFRKNGTRNDHIATHLDYDSFELEDAYRLLALFNNAQLHLSLGAFENLIGGDEAERRKNQDHLLKLIRIAHLLGGNENNIKVGTFVGYDHVLGVQENGFQKNIDAYQRIFLPIIKYAEDLGVTILYENCPMEGWRPPTYTTTFNNLSAVLAARKLMYAAIPSTAHGEIYDPSHDVWQNTSPVDVIRASDVTRVHRIHVKATRNLMNADRTHWGGMYPMQAVDEVLAKKAEIPFATDAWNRHHYEAMLPGFGGSDSMDWRAFIEALQAKGYHGPFEIENEAQNSKNTQNIAATIQGFQAACLFLAPMLWPLSSDGYQYDNQSYRPLHTLINKSIPVVNMDQILP